MVLLSICIPAYNRPEWLRRAILSILTTPIEQQPQVELVISDDSTIATCKQIVDELVVNWHGENHYCQNTPSLGMAGNWNNCIQLASGKYILILHDDDYLEPGALGKIMHILEQHPNPSAFLFGVNVVSPKQRIRKRQSVKKIQHLNPENALTQLLTDSSFIRFPGMVVKRSVFQQVGYFDQTIGEIADIQLWIRICKASGLVRIPTTTVNYTVHSESLTMDMFNPQILNRLDRLFDEVKLRNWLPEDTLEYCKANYFNQFILAGTVRYLRVWNLRKAREVFELFNKIDLQEKQSKLKWKAIKRFLKIFLNSQTI